MASSPIAALAANLNINATGPGVIIAPDANFEGGLTGNGTFGKGVQLNFTGSFVDNGLSAAITRQVYWVNSFDPTVVTETLSYSITTDGTFATITGFFQDGGALGILPGMVDAGDVIFKTTDAAQNPFTYTSAFFTGQVNVGPSPVPLPAPALMLLAGVGSLIAGRRRKKA